MLQMMISRRLDAAERELGVPVDYLRDLAKTSLSGFFKFTKLMPLAAYRKKLPLDVHTVGALVAARSADCGPCVQIGVNMARKAGVPRELIRTVLDRRVDDLTPELAEVYRFAASVCGEVPADEETLRERLIARHGKEAFYELALALTTARMFPNLKRAMGYAVSCSKVEVEV